MKSSNYLQCLSFRPCQQKTNKQKRHTKKEDNKENFLSVLFVNKAEKKTTGHSTTECLDFIIFEEGTLGFEV